MKSIRMRFAAVLLTVGGLLLSTPVYAQRELTHTTLGAAITSQSSAADTVRLASLTGVTVNSTSLWVDHEMMAVLRILSTTNLTVQVQRGANGTRAELHASGAVVSVVPAGATTSVDYVGACTKGAGEDALYEPIINTVNGHMGRCSSSKWTWADTMPLTYNSSPY